jgi:hypothetical protein
VKSAHLTNVERRCRRALDALLPDWVVRGTDLQEVDDPRQRLKEVIRRVSGAAPDGAANLVNDLVTLLETDVPELIEAVREAQGAQRRYCRYCGERRVGLLAACHDDRSAWECRDEDGCDARSDRRNASKTA